MSRWKKRLLGLFLIVAGVGAAMWAHGQATARPPAVEPPSRDLAAAEEFGRGFAERAAPREVEVEVERDDGVPWTGRLGGWLARLGISFAAGMILGVFFRTFLKAMAVISAAAIALIVGLSYFEVLPIDFTTMRENYDSAGEAVGGYAGRAKDAAMTFLPSATAATAGFFAGFLRR